MSARTVHQIRVACFMLGVWAALAAASCGETAAVERDAQADAGTSSASGAAAEEDAASCGEDVRDAGSACGNASDDGLGRCSDGCPDSAVLGELPIAVEAPLTWQAVSVEGAVCRDGSPAIFRINVNPGSDKLIVYLEQGGACLPQTCLTFFIDSPPVEGVFNRDNEDNPFADWNYVYVPYCTGDLHAGDRRDVLAQGTLQQFVGYHNMGLFLQRIVPSFRDASQVVLSGSSAGGFGTLLNYPRTQDAFEPIQVAFLDDSGPLMSSAAISPCFQKWMRDGWGLDAAIFEHCGADCPDHDEWTHDWLHHVFRRYPDARGGIYSSEGDASVRLFLGAGVDNCSAPGSSLLPVEDFRAGLDELRAVATMESKTVGTFYAGGDGHICFASSCFYETRAGQERLTDWVSDILHGTARHLGP